MLLPGLRSSIHQRLQQRCQVLRMDTCSTATHFYPLLLPLVSAINTWEFVLHVFILLNKGVLDQSDANMSG